AEADHTHRLVDDLDACVLAALPLTGAQTRGRLRNPASHGEQERNRVLRRRHDVGGRCVDDEHAACGCGGDVDVVEPDTGPSDDFELVGRSQSFRVDVRGTADNDGVDAL